MLNDLLERTSRLFELRREMVHIRRLHGLFFLTNHGETGRRLSEQFSAVVDEYEATKFWFMPMVDRRLRSNSSVKATDQSAEGAAEGSPLERDVGHDGDLS